MQVRDICVQHLKTAGFDGLFSVDGECACTTDDLMPCSNSVTGISDCEAGYVRLCDDCPLLPKGSCPVSEPGRPGSFCVGRTSDFPEASKE